MPHLKLHDTFIAEAKSIHKNKYDYTNSHYINDYTKLSIWCPTHGMFRQLPTNHLQGVGCQKCGFLSIAKTKTKSFDDFFSDAIKVHGETYSYIKNTFLNRYTKIEIICKWHGAFWQTPNHHLRGQGCPSCRWIKGHMTAINSRHMSKRLGFLYVVNIKVNDEEFIKVGVTTQSVKERFRKWKNVSIRPIYVVTNNMQNILKAENNILETFVHNKYIPNSVEVLEGHTECFKKEALLEICEFIDDQFPLSNWPCK